MRALFFWFFFSCLHWAVKLKRTCPCEHGRGAGSRLRGIKNSQSRPAAGRGKKNKTNVIKAKYLPSRAHACSQLDVVDGSAARMNSGVSSSDWMRGPLLRLVRCVCSSTCARCPWFGGYDSSQTTLLSQAAVTHCVLAGRVPICRSVLMP